MKRFVILLIIFGIIMRCSKVKEAEDTASNFTVPNNELIDESIEKLINSTIKKEYGEDTVVKISNVIEENDLFFVTILCQQQDRNFNGVVYLHKKDNGKYEYVIGNITEADYSKPISVLNIISETSENINRRFHIVTGLINHKSRLIVK